MKSSIEDIGKRVITSVPKRSVVARELHKIAKRDGGLKPSDVVDYARPKSSPLHRYFEWDNTKAAERFRLVQAMHLIRMVRIKISMDDKQDRQVRMLVHVLTDEDRLGENKMARGPCRGSYVSMIDVLSNSDYRQQMLEDAKSDLESFRRKYSILSELAEVCEAVDRFLEKH